MNGGDDQMNHRAAVAAVIGAGAFALAACGSQPAAVGAAQDRAAALHAAGECIRQHGVPSYQDPVLTPEGQVFTDQRSLQNASRTTLQAVEQACRSLVATAGFDPASEPPAPPRLVEAGVRAAQCLRAHGLPDYR